MITLWADILSYFQINVTTHSLKEENKFGKDDGDGVRNRRDEERGI